LLCLCLNEALPIFNLLMENSSHLDSGNLSPEMRAFVGFYNSGELPGPGCRTLAMEDVYITSGIPDVFWDLLPNSAMVVDGFSNPGELDFSMLLNRDWGFLALHFGLRNPTLRSVAIASRSQVILQEVQKPIEDCEENLSVAFPEGLSVRELWDTIQKFKLRWRTSGLITKAHTDAWPRLRTLEWLNDI
jgi:hypothetical protein